MATKTKKESIAVREQRLSIEFIKLDIEHLEHHLSMVEKSEKKDSEKDLIIRELKNDIEKKKITIEKHNIQIKKIIQGEKDQLKAEAEQGKARLAAEKAKEKAAKKETK